MKYRRNRSKNLSKFEMEEIDPRLRATSIIIIIGAFLIIARLFVLMVLQHGFYTALAQGSHTMYSKLFPERGNIYVQDSRTGDQFPVAINKDMFLMYADTREIDSDDQADKIATELGQVLEYDDQQKLALYLQLNKRDDPYEPLLDNMEEDTVDIIKALDLDGILFTRNQDRFYPESNLASHVIGFLGKNQEGDNVGRYGIEGYWDGKISGQGGFLEGARSARGRWIPLAGRLFKPAEDGVDVKLTIERTVQFKSCQILRQAMEEYAATSASLLIINPKNGAILALCSLPDFDLNNYGEVEDSYIYNNSAIFTPYEPGSIFKPIAAAAALNEEAITPQTSFYDTGSRTDICDTPIRNASQKVYKDTDMIGVMENSINTGMVYVVEELGKNLFRDYVENFGFGTKTGIELDTEVSGTIDSLFINKKDRLDCYTATASFGQGITVTPLQMAVAYSAIANGGKLVKPYIVEELRFPNKQVEKTRPKEVRQVITKRAASLLSGMLVKVVDSGHAGSAGVEGFYVAGKTGTAQISGRGGYTEDTNHSFVGFAPVDDPKFVAIVKFEKPERKFSASTAAPTFGKIAKFILDYYQVAPGRD